MYITFMPDFGRHRPGRHGSRTVDDDRIGGITGRALPSLAPQRRSTSLDKAAVPCMRRADVVIEGVVGRAMELALRQGCESARNLRVQPMRRQIAPDHELTAHGRLILG
jgi:hypothetical protein